MGTPDICLPVYAIKMVADILAPISCQAITNHHDDSITIMYSHMIHITWLIH